MSTNALVKFAGVQKTYDGKNLVVRDLNLDIQVGEFLSLPAALAHPRLAG